MRTAAHCSMSLQSWSSLACGGSAPGSHLQLLLTFHSNLCCSFERHLALADSGFASMHREGTVRQPVVLDVPACTACGTSHAQPCWHVKLLALILGSTAQISTWNRCAFLLIALTRSCQGSMLRRSGLHMLGFGGYLARSISPQCITDCLCGKTVHSCKAFLSSMFWMLQGGSDMGWPLCITF